MTEPADGSDPARLGAWKDDLTFQEVHAFTWGFGLTALAVATGSQLLMATVVGLALFAFTGRWAKAKAMGVDVEDYVKKQIRREPQYFLGGVVAGAAVGHAVYVLGFVPAVPF